MLDHNLILQVEGIEGKHIKQLRLNENTGAIHIRTYW